MACPGLYFKDIAWRQVPTTEQFWTYRNQLTCLRGNRIVREAHQAYREAEMKRNQEGAWLLADSRIRPEMEYQGFLSWCNEWFSSR